MPYKIILISFVWLGWPNSLSADNCTIEFTGENGQQATNVGYLPTGTSATGHLTEASLPFLGTSVWEVTVMGSVGGYHVDLSDYLFLDDGFRYSGYFQILQGGGRIANLLRTTGPDEAFGAAPNTAYGVGLWFYVEMERQPSSNEFDRAISVVDEQTGELIPLQEDFNTEAREAGAILSLVPDNSAVMMMANNGSSRLRVQFDNVVIEVIRPPCTKGDFTDDEIVDLSDIVAFAATLLDPSTASPDDRCRTDLNNDCLINGADIQQFVDCLSSANCP